MEAMVCAVCGYIHFGDGHPKQCPVCHSDGDKFSVVADAIKKPADANNLTEGEQKHIPSLNIGREDNEVAFVAIDVGAIPHVMTEEHHINYVDVYLDNKPVLRAVFLDGMSQASVALPINTANAAEIKVVANCNVHGNWVEGGKL